MDEFENEFETAKAAAVERLAVQGGELLRHLPEDEISDSEPLEIKTDDAGNLVVLARDRGVLYRVAEGSAWRLENTPAGKVVEEWRERSLRASSVVQPGLLGADPSLN
jgi:hypothetical protein